MLETEETYDPLEVEEAIDDAYRIAEELEEYSEKITETIENFEDLPYSVNRDENYTEDELVQAVQALNTLENIYWAAEEEREEIGHIETLLTEKAFKPARNHGKML